MYHRLLINDAMATRHIHTEEREGHQLDKGRMGEGPQLDEDSTFPMDVTKDFTEEARREVMGTDGGCSLVA